METTFGIRALKDLFGFPFRDPKWGTKFLIGSLIFISGFFVPFFPWIMLTGYTARQMRLVLESEGRIALPEWDDWGKLFIDGIKLSLAAFLLNLPAILLFLFGFGSYFGTMMGAIVMDSLIGEQAAAPFFLLMVLSMGFMFFSMSVGTLLVLVAWFLIPPTQAHMVATGRLSSFFDVPAWGRVLRANLGGFVLVLLVLFGLWAVQYLLFTLVYMTFVLCFLIPVVIAPISFYTQVITALLAAQAYREGRDKLLAQTAPAVSIEAPGVA